MTLLSPGVEVIERDASTRIETVTSSTGAIVVHATRGPVNQVIDITSPSDYVDVFGVPDDVNYKFAWTAMKFSEASSSLKAVRIEDSTRLAAGVVVGFTPPTSTQPQGDLTAQPEPMQVVQYPLVYDSVGTASTTGGPLDVTGAEKLFHVYAVGPGPFYENITFAVVSNFEYITLQNFKRDLAQAVLETDRQAVIARYWTGISGDELLSRAPSLRDDVIISQPRTGGGQVDTNNTSAGWAIDSGLLSVYTSPEYGPAPDVVSYDMSGNPVYFYDSYLFYVFDETGALDDVYMLSTNPEKRDGYGNNMFGPKVVNGNNKYVNIFTSNSETASEGIEVTWSIGRTPLMGADGLAGYSDASHDGVLDADPGLGQLEGEIFGAWQKFFGNKETHQIDLLLDADYSDNVKREMDNLAKNIRKDCFAILNMPETVMINPTTKKVVDQVYTQMANYVASDLNINSSYSAIYGNYFKIFDNYGEKERWVPVSGFVGATYARTDFAYAQWWAPAGLTRGIVDNVIDTAVNPSQAQRDILYQNRINPIVKFLGQGIIIWGQKTLQARPSAFDRVNVRRLFLFLERSIERLARYYIFELNDEVTRTRFSNSINNFLAEIKAKRGVYDYLVVADETNNTPDVIDRNEFVAEILVKPVRVIEFIKLIFTAVATGVNFQELVGRG
jgi:phage tail sheath protein FI